MKSVLPLICLMVISDAYFQQKPVKERTACTYWSIPNGNPSPFGNRIWRNMTAEALTPEIAKS